jgi:hypothetical protein
MANMTKAFYSKGEEELEWKKKAEPYLRRYSTFAEILKEEVYDYNYTY